MFGAKPQSVGQLRSSLREINLEGLSLHYLTERLYNDPDSEKSLVRIINLMNPKYSSHYLGSILKFKMPN